MLLSSHTNEQGGSKSGVNKIYISAINVSDQAAQVHISEGEFDSLDSSGDTIEVTYTGNEASSYLIKVKFTESNMRIRIKKKGEADLSPAPFCIQQKCLVPKPENMWVHVTVSIPGSINL